MNHAVPIRATSTLNSRFDVNRNCATCEIRNGIPTANVWGYYTSRAGVRMLVVECSLDQRIRINGTIEIIVLEVGSEAAQLGIEGAANPDKHTGG